MKIIGRAPSTIANLGALYDIGGIAVNAFQDKVILEEKTTDKHILNIIGNEGKTLARIRENIVLHTIETLQKKCLEKTEPLTIILEKNVPVAKGLGSSAASIAATIDAFIKKYPESKCTKKDYIEIGGEMEGKISGSVHYDNILPSLLGNGVLIYSPESKPPEYTTFSWPQQLMIIIGVPHNNQYKIKEKTKKMREILPKKTSLKNIVRATGYASLFFHALYKKDFALLGKAINHGGIIEEKRAEFIPGYWTIKEKLLEEKALGVNISGAGPSIFAITHKEQAAHLAKTMKKITEKYMGETMIIEAQVYKRSIL